MNTETINIEVTWLGQGGFLFIIDGIRIVVDPYLSDSLAKKGVPRLVEVPVDITDLNPDYVLITHDHADHFDEETMMPLTSLYPSCVFVGPESVKKHYLNMGFNIDRFVLLNNGMSFKCKSIEIEAVPAYHTDPYSIGFVFTYQDNKIYISGDTLLTTQLIPSLQQIIGPNLSLMMICINGKLGNMTDAEAVEVVNALNPKSVVPMHYGMFESNTVDPQFFTHSINKSNHCEVMLPGITKTFNLQS